MKTNLKKLALTSMAVSVFAAPLVVLASCTTFSKINYDITSKPYPEITENDIEGNNYMELSTLEKVFDGINEENLQHLIVTKNEITDGGVYTLTLEAKKAYSIQEKSILISEPFTLINHDFDLNISLIDNPIVDIEDIENNQFMQLSTLVKVFDGINNDKLNNLTVLLNTVVPGSIFTITLNANNGFTIGGETTLTSNLLKTDVILNITAKTLAPFSILGIDVNNDNFKSFATINKLFNLDPSITQEILDVAVTITMNPMTGSQPRIVTLTANRGYNINDQPTLDSNQFTLPVNYMININNIVPTDIKPSDIDGDKFKDFNVISKLFTGPDLTQANLANFDIEKNEITPNSIFTITLIPKLGYTLNNSTVGLTSLEFTLNIVNLSISRQVTIPGDITQEDINNPNIFKSKVFLDKLFDFGTLTQADIDNYLNVTVEAVAGGTEYKIILSTKSMDEIINGNFSQLDSEQFSLYVRDMPISKVAVVPTDITISDIEDPATLRSKAFLDKLFDLGTLTQIEIDNLLIVTLETVTVGMDYQISLSPNGSVTINGQSNEFKSDQFSLKVTDILISRAATIPTDITLADVENPTTLNNKEFLSKLFDLGSLTQLEIEEMLDVTLETITAGLDYKISLSPKNIYVKINGQSNAFISDQFSLEMTDVLIARAATVPTDITLVEVENPITLKSKEFLEKLFDLGSLTQNEIDSLLIVNLEIITVGIDYRVSLSPKNIYVKINGQSNEFLSDQFSLKVTNILISKAPTIPTDITLTDVENPITLKSKGFLDKLFNLGTLVQQEIDEMLDVTLETITVGMEYQVSLSPKNIYVKINGQSDAFVSDRFSLYIRNLAITRNPNIPTDVTLADVENEGIYKTKEFLSKLFDLGSLTQSEIDELLDITLEIITAGMDYRISLSPKNIYININGQSNAFSSNDFSLQVTNIIVTKSATIPTDILLEDIEDPNVLKNKDFLSKLFDLGSLTQLDIDGMLDIALETIVAETTYRITLSPRNIYVKINNSYDAFSSDQFNLADPINIDVVVIDPIIADITTIDIDHANLATLATLSKLFRFDPTMDQTKLNQSVVVTLNDNTLGGMPAKSITLTRKYGHSINGGISITSKIFMVQEIMTNVTVITSPVLQLNTDDMSSGSDWVKVLQNFFTLTEEQIENNITATINGNIYSGNPITITLTANEGFVFPDGRTITSVEFTIDIVMHFVPRSFATPGLTVNDLTNQLTSNEVMLMLFWQYSVDNLANITARVNGQIIAGNRVTVTIIANDGYTFADGKEMTSNEFVIEAG
ncbi:MAG: hypothetical protein ACRC7B_02230 [Metamycoplasmataceae bacterium]